MSMVKTFTALTLVLGFAAAVSIVPVASAAERSGQAAESHASGGTAGQSADGEQDIRDVGEAGGGGQSSGEMKPLDNTSQQPASGPDSKPLKPKSQ